MNTIEKPIEKEIGGLRVIYGYPPIWDSVVSAFQVIPATACFTYNDRVYNPSQAYLPDHVIVHEKVHIRQQGGTEEGAALWWGKFLRDPAFRIEQELEAYAEQYKYVCTKQKDRNTRFNFLLNISRTFAGPLYGKCIDSNEAMKLIKNKSGVQ